MGVPGVARTTGEVALCGSDGPRGRFGAEWLVAAQSGSNRSANATVSLGHYTQAVRGGEAAVEALEAAYGGQ